MADTATITEALQLAHRQLMARALMDIEIHQTRSGHWHAPGHCSHQCPMSQTATAARFHRELARAAGFPDRNPWR